MTMDNMNGIKAQIIYIVIAIQHTHTVTVTTTK